MYDPSVGSWVTTGANLPRPMSDMRAINIIDRVLIFGKVIFISRPKHFLNQYFLKYSVKLSIYLSIYIKM